MGNARFVETTRKQPPGATAGETRVPVLVIAHHPTLARAGESLAIHDRVELSRLSPAFGSALADRDPSPLDDPFVSRKAFVLRRDGDAIEIENPEGVELSIGGTALVGSRGADELARGGTGSRRITAGELARGIDLVLGGRVVLWLTLDHAGASDELGMVGSSHAMAALRADIRAAAKAPGPILIEGETGVGKDLVARALHGCGPRAERPLVAVNVAAIPAAVAAAELFGHEKGAFTGATERRAGYFERADGGVLFADEIGDLPESVQPMLLRVLESGEIQPIGGSPKRVDVLVVAATDADLARAAQTGRYRGPLYYRLAGTTLRVPPLRDRRVDIGPLLARFLLEQLDGPLADQATAATPWLPATVVGDLVRAAWPGNIRQLRAVAARLAAIARAGRTASLDQLGAALGLEELDVDDPGSAVGVAGVGSGVSANAVGSGVGSNVGVGSGVGSRAVQVASRGEDRAQVPIDDVRLTAVLRAHKFQLNRAAEQLGISRTHLDALIARSGLRKAKDVPREEIAAASAELAGDTDAMAARLEVSPRGLKLRMRQLGL